MNPSRDRRGLSTRLCHLGLALAVIVQLATSQFMEGPRPGRPQNFAFTIHEISGLTALFCAFCFWFVLAVRRRDTPATLLFPWLSVRRISDVFRDLSRHLNDVFRLHVPRYEDDSPLASAVHGLGLLLMSAMAITGTIWLAAHLVGVPQNAFLHLDMTIHKFFANLVWVYLIGHALLALVHHVAGQSSLAKMWSVRSG